VSCYSLLQWDIDLWRAGASLLFCIALQELLKLKMFAQEKNGVRQIVRSSGGQRKLHTIHALLRGRIFVGQFQAKGETYDFSFVPAEASIAQQKCVLRGRFSVKPPKQSLRFTDQVEAVLVATQGAVGASPVRRQLLTGTAQTAEIATPEQKLEQEKGPETELQPGLHAFDPPKRDSLGRPTVESTDALSFVGVLYFHLSPLDGEALGIPLDVSKVQLGGRLAPTDNRTRDLQFLFSDLVMALSDNSDSEATNSCLAGINSILQE
jgi:hypothetical protein